MFDTYELFLLKNYKWKMLSDELKNKVRLLCSQYHVEVQIF